MAMVESWVRSVGVEVNNNKTCVMIRIGGFSRNRRHIVKVGEYSLGYVEQVRYLGVHVGEKLNFIPHLGKIRVKLLKVVGQVRRVLRCERGSHY